MLNSISINLIVLNIRLKTVKYRKPTLVRIKGAA